MYSTLEQRLEVASQGESVTYRKGDKPRLKFGKYGEITAETVRQAGLNKAETEQAEKIVDANQAFLEILDTLSYPVDPDGHVHDLNHMTATNIAIAWTLALNGFRRTGPVIVKKRYFTAPGVYQDAHTWVRVDAPDFASQELRPEHSSMDVNLPPDTRKLAADRDGEEAVNPQQEWHTTPKVIHTYEKRPEGV